MLQKLNMPLLGLRLVSVVICLLGLMRIITFILPGVFFTPKIHINVTSVSEVFIRSHELLSEMLRARFGWENNLLISYIVIGSFLGSVFYVLCGVFLFLRKSWARKAMIFYTVLIFLNSFTVRVLTRTFTIDFSTVYLCIFNLALLFYFTGKPVIELFHPHSTLNQSK
jgi:hypothetical protein